MNELLKDSAKKILKELLLQCSHAEQLMFKRMYCSNHLEYSIDQAINQMDANRMDMALNQVQRTVNKNNKK